MNKLIFGLILLLAPLSYAQQTHSFKAFFSAFDSLSADFQQNNYNNAGILLNSATGYLKFQRPKQLLWQTNTPNKQTLLLNKNQLWLIDFDLEQASLQQITNFEETPLYWLTNRADKISYLPKYTHTKNGLDWYATGQKNDLRFGFQNHNLHSITLNNKLGQRLVLKFTTLKINPAFDKNTFKLAIDPTFDIIK